MSSKDKKDSLLDQDHNKEIVKKTKEILKEFGYEIKTSHIYETFSKLSGVKDWNSAKSLQKDFKDVIREVLPLKEGKFEIPEELKKFLNLSEKDVLNLGYLVEGKLPLTKELRLHPNAIFVGDMGTGKSVASKFTILTHLMNNDDTIVVIVDLENKGSDYKEFENIPQVLTVVKSPEQMFNLIDILYSEMQLRKQEFIKLGVEDYRQYEEKTGKKLSRIIMSLEHFHGVPNKILNFNENKNQEGTPAKKFYHIMREGLLLRI